MTTENKFSAGTPASEYGRPNAVEFKLARILHLVDQAVELRMGHRPPQRVNAIAANDDVRPGRSA